MRLRTLTWRYRNESSYGSTAWTTSTWETWNCVRNWETWNVSDYFGPGLGKFELMGEFGITPVYRNVRVTIYRVIQTRRRRGSWQVTCQKKVHWSMFAKRLSV